jgi:hypothetical protein
MYISYWNLPITFQKYRNPLLSLAQTKRPLISAEDIKILFSNVEIIYAYNSMLFDGLSNRMKAWSSQQKIGDIFLSLVSVTLSNSNIRHRF